MPTLKTQLQNNLNRMLGSNRPDKIAIAVSGGVDSMALMHLMSGLNDELRTRLYILHVDHGLRPESAYEAEFVRQKALDIGVEFAGLAWLDTTKEHGNLQERAREARYQLLTGFCHENSIFLLITAHTEDDLIETYLMRRKRGSNVLGLASSNRHFVDDIEVLRPLYNVRKKSLIEFMQENELEWAEDPTNATLKYDRNKIRRELASYAAEQLESVLKEMALVAKQAEQLNKELIEQIAEHVSFYPFGVAEISFEVFMAMGLDLQVPILSYMLTMVSGRGRMPRFRNIQSILDGFRKLYEILKQVQDDTIGTRDDNIQTKFTLHGAVIEERNEKITIYREQGDISKEIIKLCDGVVFDKRFQFLVSDDLGDGYSVSVLTLEDIKALKNTEEAVLKLTEFDEMHHKNIKFTLPVVRFLEKIVAIPHIFYYDGKVLKEGIKVSLRPNFTSRFTHFLGNR